ncbi:MAG: transketolase [Epsilonproteobacteria bacterium]|nr:transketolase [Campylobacterota bacterium]OIO14234.1 MAG: transketolase [Helicobacteraceae bacterium CG1_02_36_14]PIP09956.1 MAG: transketolase [Sulfurimonas sp. CG23_combo_of_CG06-09_8_20_14_all_36_33]PIS26909.1 MAG: transketolase [Sulfurimonas sp. CG08_land_8_20_14_0_20_36_33]PIU34724.1 MAG: transketolase [Sulfurimonas sp. CG07_land_8_20_14_0_80_36_56]PIV03618.1 MAG: transketolase [Sulfurimonas sp. CG03_land_8_20_14_0_80_36_25]PIV35845.1 MAG: transketolase [Sulfurimonas sp. CG02_land_8_2
MRNSVANEIKKIAKQDKSLFVISGDAGLGVWDDFNTSEQFINPGVNEQLDVGFAAGMALMGHKVIYYNIAPFVIMRPYEFVRNDICYQELPVILVGTGSGITYAPAGMTHYVVEDITLASTMPNLDIFSPADPVEAVACFNYAYASKKPSYIRIAKNGEDVIHKEEIDITKPIFIHRSSSKHILLLHGSIVDEVSKILEIVDLNIVSVPMLTSDFDWEEFLSAFDKAFTLEEHFINGGFGTILKDKCDKKIHKFGLKNEYIHKIGNRDYLRKYYGIDGKIIGQKIEEITKG